MTVEIGLSLESADYVRGANDAKRAVKGLAGAQDDASGSASGLGATSTTTTGKLGGLAGKAKAAAVALGPVGIGVAAGAAVVGLVKVGAAVLDTAASIEDSRDAFDAVFLEMADEVDAFAQEFGGLVGVSDRTARDFLTNTQGIIKGLGFSNEAAASMSQTVLTLGGDLASFTGETNERAQSALKSALVGETESLKELGIVMTAAEVETRALADSGKESAKALTQQEKAAARVHLVMEKMGRQGSLGDAARTSDSLRTQLNQLGRAWGNMRDTLVPILANVLRPVVAVIVALALKINENREVIGRWVSGTIQLMKTWFEVISIPVRTIIETIVDLGTVFVRVMKGDFRGAAEAAKDALNVVPESIARVKSAITSAGEAVALFKGETEDANAAMAATAATDAPAMAAAMGGTTGSVATGAAAATDAVKEFQASIAEMPGLAEPPLRLTSDALRFLRTDAEEEFMKIRDGWQEIPTALLEVPEVTFPAVVAETKSFGEKLTGIFNSVTSGIGGLFESLFSADPGGILSFAQNLVPGLGGILSGVVGDFAKKLGFGGEAATSVGAGLQQMAELAASVLPPPAGTIAGAVASLVPVFENVVGAIGGIFKSGTDGWVEAAEAAGIAMTQTFADAAHAMGQSMDEALENARKLQEHFAGLGNEEYQLGLAQGFTGSRDEVIDQFRRHVARQSGNAGAVPGDPTDEAFGGIPGRTTKAVENTAKAVKEVVGKIAKIAATGKASVGEIAKTGWAVDRTAKAVKEVAEKIAATGKASVEEIVRTGWAVDRTAKAVKEVVEKICLCRNAPTIPSLTIPFLTDEQKSGFRNALTIPFLTDEQKSGFRNALTIPFLTDEQKSGFRNALTIPSLTDEQKSGFRNALTIPSLTDEQISGFRNALSIPGLTDEQMSGFRNAQSPSPSLDEQKGDSSTRTANAVEQIAGAITQVVSPSGVTNQVDRFATGAQRASGGSGFAFGT